MKKKDIVDLINYHEEGNDYAFTEKAQQIADDFRKSGDEELGNYIDTLVAKTNIFVPQTSSLTFLEEVPATPVGQLPLPEKVADKLEWIVNAIYNSMDVNKFLFKGQPGTGKNASAKTIAKILNRKLLRVDCQSLISEKPGQSPINLTQAFYEINNYPHPKQIIVLLEGVDAIASDQDAFLKGLDSVLPGFTIIATANSLESFKLPLSLYFDLIVNFDQYSQEDLTEVAAAIMNNVYQEHQGLEKNIRLFKKIIALYGDRIPLPGDLKKMVKTGVAFSNIQADPAKYLQNIYQCVTGHPPELHDLQKGNFTIREMAILTGMSKSTVGRKRRDD